MDNQTMFNKKLSIHKMAVQSNMDILMKDMRARSRQHDNSMRSGIENTLFGEDSNCTLDIWGIKPMGETRSKELLPAMIVHAENNEYRPEHFDNGMVSMTLPQISEMLCDIVATAKEQQIYNLGPFIRKTLSEKYNIQEPLTSILVNTADELMKR